MKLPPPFLLALTLCTAAFAPANAAVIIVAPTLSTPGSFQITEDITFPITGTGVTDAIGLDEWVVSDGTRSSSSFPINLFYSINGGTPVAFGGVFTDNSVSGSFNLSANDGYFSVRPVTLVVPGDTFTLKAGLTSLATTAFFNQQTTQTFIGNMFVTDGGRRISSIVKAPEPTAFAFVGLGSLVLSRRRPRPAARLN